MSEWKTVMTLEVSTYEDGGAKFRLRDETGQLVHEVSVETDEQADAIYNAHYGLLPAYWELIVYGVS